MKVTEWAYEYIVGFLAADKAAGKAFIKTLSPFAGEDENCLDVLKLVPLGQQGSDPVAFATVCPCKKDFHDFIEAVKEGAPFSDPRYDYGKNKGITLTQFNAIKSKVAFIATRIIRDLITNEVIPRQVTLDEYLANKGYEVKSEP